MKRRLVLLGPPASGKGTQAEMIRERFEIPSGSPGEMLRQEKAAGTELGLDADKLTSNGQLLPDATIISLVEGWLEKHDGAFAFDGFPRTIGQADALQPLLAQRGTPLEAVILLEVDLETIEARVKSRLVCERCGKIVSIGLQVESENSLCPSCHSHLVRRGDDNLATLEKRMIEYRDKTEPLVSYYENSGLLHRVEANSTPEQVFQKISEILE